MRLRAPTPRRERAAGIFFPRTDERGDRLERFKCDPAVGEQKVFFTDGVPGELFRERTVGRRGFAEDEHAGGFLVESAKYGEASPARLAMPQPFVNALARMRI